MRKGVMIADKLHLWIARNLDRDVKTAMKKTNAWNIKLILE